MNIRHILSGALAMAVCAGAEAQDSNLRTEINVDRTVVPVQRPASPLQSVRPVILSPSYETHTLHPAEYGNPSPFDNTISPLTAVAYPGLKGRSPYRGYAAIGYFPIFNLGASAGYRFIDTRNTTLKAWLQYDGVKYKAHGIDNLANGDRPSVQNNTFTIGADLRQRIGRKSQLTAALDFTYAGLKLPEMLSGKSEIRDRSLGAFRAAAGYESSFGVLKWHVGAAFDHFKEGKDLTLPLASGISTVKGAAENLTSVTLGTSGAFSKSTYIGLEATADILHRSSGLLLLETSEPNEAIAHPSAPVTAGTPEDRTMAIVRLQPFFGAKVGHINTRLGVDVNINTVNLGSHVHVAPNVLLDWNPASTVAVYARFRGGDSFNTLRSLYTRMGAFAPGAFLYTSSNTPIAADFGFNIGPFKGATLEIFGSYAATHNAPMPVMLAYSSGTTGALLNVNLSGWRAGAALGYTWRDYLKARASFEVLPHSYSSGYLDEWDRARTVTRVKISGRPIERLDLTASYALRTGRRYYEINAAPGAAFAPEAIHMPNTSELNIGATYAINDAVSAYIRGENLLCRRAPVLPWLPGQGLKGLLGIEVKF